jgi:hypothetical protein
VSEEVERRVRRLLLSGDNTLKNRTGAQALARARERYEEALGLATEAGLEERILDFVRLRLRNLGGGGPAAPEERPR